MSSVVMCVLQLLCKAYCAAAFMQGMLCCSPHASLPACADCTCCVHVGVSQCWLQVIFEHGNVFAKDSARTAKTYDKVLRALAAISEPASAEDWQRAAHMLLERANAAYKFSCLIEDTLQLLLDGCVAG